MGCSASKPAFRGAIKLRLAYDQERKQLVVRVKQGRNLLALDLNGKSDVFVVVTLSSEKHKEKKQTKVKNKTLHPVWDEEIMWKDFEVEDEKETMIDISVWDKDFHSADDFMGQLTIPFHDVISEDEGDGLHGWFELLDHDEGAGSYKYLGLNWQPDLPAEYGQIACPTAEADDESEYQQVNFDEEDVANITAESSKSNKKERKYILEAAKAIGEEREKSGAPRRHITCFYNPVSGNGTAKRIVDHNVTPVFRLAHVEYDVIPTQYAGHAVEMMRDMDISKTDGVLIAGGDGLVHEVITGYCLREDKGNGLPVGIVPSGSANAMAHELHTEDNHSAISVVGRAALCAAKGVTRKIDVLRVGTEGECDDVFALSVLGWGLAGAVALQAAKLRWIPGQKRVRYDLAGFITMIKSWPVLNKAKMNFLVDKKDEETGEVVGEEWIEEDVSLINMIVTNMSKLGLAHPIIEGVSPDDGYFGLVVIDGNASRRDVVSVAMAMKRGKFMANHRASKSWRVKQVKIVPDAKSLTPYNIDGDPLDAMPIHIECLHHGISVFAETKHVTAGSEHAED